VRKLRYTVCDVFTDVPLAGNQLAVFTDGRDLSSIDMQALAREMNFSETVFCLPPTTDADVRIRIFTPANELPFAGHPVLGTAFVLGGPLSKIVIRLETEAGVVPVELEREGPRIVFGWMDQPLPNWQTVPNVDEIMAALGVVDEPAIPVERYDLGPGHVYLELASADAVAALSPNAAALVHATTDSVNCFAPDGARWKTRNFAPAAGVFEDPATGSAAGPLVLHLARHGRVAFGEEIEISQGTEVNRPSTLYAVAEGTSEKLERVRVGGSAVIVARGQFTLP
jgi:trans-2,3-dihydro-3-hydroxyanthranilate isomerase